MIHRANAGNGMLWSVILAGGDGERTREFVQRRLGHRKPKQYCAFVGTRSLLQHTIDRADRLSDPSRRVLVVGSHHWAEVDRQLRGRARGLVLYQPRNRGTAPGVFLALSEVGSQDPEATIVIYPADHFVYPEDAFVDPIASAVALVAEFPDRPVLLGVAPRGPETEYGWIEPGAPLPWKSRKGGAARRVIRFVEKPSGASAAELLARHGVWNTSVVVGKLSTLVTLGWRFVPEIMLPWLRARMDPLGASLDEIYREMPVRDFSRDLLQHACGTLAVLEANGFYWNDWGHPSRIQETLARPEWNEERRLGRRVDAFDALVQSVSRRT